MKNDGYIIIALLKESSSRATDHSQAEVSHETHTARTSLEAKIGRPDEEDVCRVRSLIRKSLIDADTWEEEAVNIMAMLQRAFSRLLAWGKTGECFDATSRAIFALEEAAPDLGLDEADPIIHDLRTSINKYRDAREGA